MARSDLLNRGWLPWLALLALFLAAPLRAQEMSLGINAMWGSGAPEELRERMRKARSLGVTQVRIDWEWRLAEAVRGRYDWTRLDALARVAGEEGVELLPIVHYAPDWALVDETKAADVYELAPRADAYADYGRFLRACIERYGVAGAAKLGIRPIRYWQVWNEPNVKQFWGPKPNAEAFVQLMQAVDKAVGDLRGKDVQLVHAGISRVDIEYFWQLWEADKAYASHFDILAVHPYLFDMRDGVRDPAAMDGDELIAGAMGFVGSRKDPAYLGKVFNLQLFMTLRGFPGKPIWITEEGYVVSRHKLGVTEDEQARRLGETIAFVRQHLTDAPYGEGKRALAANVQRLYWFSLEDYPSPDGLGDFGLYRADGSQRPAADAFRQLVR